jgi:pentatricopeptide repeat protein
MVAAAAVAPPHHRCRFLLQVFDYLRSLPLDHGLAQLCDVFTYTAMVSLCVDNQELSRALELVAEMKQRQVECNVHTFTYVGLCVCEREGGFMFKGGAVAVSGSRCRHRKAGWVALPHPSLSCLPPEEAAVCWLNPTIFSFLHGP